MWVLTPMISVTLFPAQCMSATERGNEQLWDVRHTSGHLIQTISHSPSGSTQLSPSTAQVSAMDCTPQGLFSYPFTFEGWIPDSSGMSQNVVSSFLKCVSGLPANGPKSNYLILSTVGGCLLDSTPVQSITDIEAQTEIWEILFKHNFLFVLL